MPLGRMLARWVALPVEAKIHWILRVGIVGCFIGHGAYGFITKEAWVPYFAVVGIDRLWAHRLMPAIGTMDVGLGLVMLFLPVRIIPLHLTVWGIWTAALRPLSGDSVWEMVERAGNYGVPMAFLALAGVRPTLREWFVPLSPTAMPSLTLNTRRTLHWILRATTFMLLLGHGALGALNNKHGLTQHYASVGLHNVVPSTVTTTQLVGGFEIALAVLVLLVPLPRLLIAVCLWKMASESLFMTSGALPFEWIERAGSYAAPLALYYLVAPTLHVDGAADRVRGVCLEHGER